MHSNEKFFKNFSNNFSRANKMTPREMRFFAKNRFLPMASGEKILKPICYILIFFEKVDC